MYCAVGLWNSFFLILYSLFDVSRLMRWSTRSTEEIFALFISIAFCNDAFTAVRKSEFAEFFNVYLEWVSLPFDVKIELKVLIGVSLLVLRTHS